ncbi:MAG: hypothetical protein BWX57_00520 [Tenericutes bacterium ADurb.Bin024]|nr:MAG: hypothetical protein BWX57_00520 [Tenericutes bacterium ADurb.Bin024]
MIGINHNEIEQEVTATLRAIAVDNDFEFELPLDINAKTLGMTLGVPVVISLYNEAFYYQITISDYRRSNFMQVSMRLFMGEVAEPKKIYPLINKLNTKLLYAKIVLNEEENQAIIIEHDFNVASAEQLSESIYDFLVDLVDDDVSPLIEEILREIGD